MAEATAGRRARIAYLVMCHLDPDHVARLALKLTEGDAGCSVLIHVDRKSDMAEALARKLAGRPRVQFVEPRVDVYWGGHAKVKALYALLRLAFDSGAHDRFVILQGADYPIKSPAAIAAYFGARPDQELIRACDATAAKGRYLCGKARYPLFYDRPTILKRLWNKAVRVLDLRLRSGVLTVGGRPWHIFWGSAQIAFTRPLAELFLSYETSPELDRFFRAAFPGDELFFQTIAFNSPFRERTTDGAPIPETEGVRLVSTRNVCYFEYPKQVTVFTEADFERLCAVEELFIRKVTTAQSAALLDRIDAMHAAGARPAA